MKCEIRYDEDISKLPLDDLNVYRVVYMGQNVYVRIDIDGKSTYFSLIDGKVTIHSKELFNMIKDSDFDNCELTTIIDVILDEVVYYLGVKRTELFRKFDQLFERITEGQVKNVGEVKDLRKEIQTLYSDSSSLFYVAKKLSKFVSKDTLDNVAFAYERSEILITRSADLYNIYLTEVQNELNIIIKKLTSISFIFLPITAIASIYAVSYSSLPSSLDSIDTVYFLTPLIVLGIVLTLYLKKINWL
ncbi:CorA family divalent cation transporter [Stygiolobus sp. CP850M]|uniref:CorA family divalent cation transporter n=1 Tax=Stygiolobus sp. CP850M TaxID=3133134 RepID=UPI00307E2A2D